MPRRAVATAAVASEKGEGKGAEAMSCVVGYSVVTLPKPASGAVLPSGEVPRPGAFLSAVPSRPQFLYTVHIVIHTVSIPWDKIFWHWAFACHLFCHVSYKVI